MTVGSKPQILIVDDDVSMRHSLELLLTRAGHEVLTACNGAEAIRVWRDRGADLVIVDLFMPEKDGIETLLALRADSPHVRIIAMSGGGKDTTGLHLLRDAKLLGAISTIEKPFSPAAMMELVNRAFEGPH